MRGPGILPRQAPRRHCSRVYRNSRRRRNNDAAGQSPNDGRSLDRRLHRFCARRGLDELALLVDEGRAFNPDWYGPGGRRLDKRTGGGPGLRTVQHLHMVELTHIHCHGGLASRAPGGKVVLAHCSGAGGAIDVCNVGDIRDVGDVHDIHVGLFDVYAAALAHVGDVDLVDITGAGVVPGPVRLTRTEREPDGDAQAANVDAAGKDHQCGRPNRVSGRRAGDPSPAAAERNPTAIMEGSVAP